MKKQILFLVMIIAVMGVVSGCAEKKTNEVRSGVANNQVKDQTQSNQVATSTISELIATSSDVIDTSNWETYNNEEYGFQVKYPKGWTYKTDNAGFVEFYDENKKIYYEGGEVSLFSISRRNFTSEQERDKYLENWKNKRFTGKYGQTKDISIGGMNMIQYKDYLELISIVKHKNYFYGISKSSASYEYNSIDNIYNEFLKSFIIID